MPAVLLEVPETPVLAVSCVAVTERRKVLEGLIEKLPVAPSISAVAVQMSGGNVLPKRDNRIGRMDLLMVESHDVAVLVASRLLIGETGVMLLAAAEMLGPVIVLMAAVVSVEISGDGGTETNTVFVVVRVVLRVPSMVVVLPEPQPEIVKVDV